MENIRSEAIATIIRQGETRQGALARIEKLSLPQIKALTESLNSRSRLT